ncbi:MAG: LacI family DNA-binding transcriptional regulator [Phycisphaeraceae bacterium JB051]
MTTIYKIGKDLGVSPMTVSNALNYRKNVAEKTALRIREYAKKIGYQPSHMARSLSKGRTKTIGICLRASPRNPHYSSILDILSQRVREMGYTLNIMLTNGQLDQVRQALTQLAEHRVEAVVIGPLGYMHQYKELEQELSRLPNVQVFAAVENLPADYSMQDVYRGSQEVLGHLHDLGHRKIGYAGAIEMETQLPGVRNRYTAYRDTLNLYRLPYSADWLILEEQCCLGFNFHMVDQLAKLLKERYEKCHQDMPTGWLCHNDWVAAQLIKALKQLNLSVPDDVSVVGMGNQSICIITEPTITTCAYDIDVYVNHMADLIVKRLKLEPESEEKPLPQGQQVVNVIEPQLILRGSSGPAPSQAR